MQVCGGEEREERRKDEGRRHDAAKHLGHSTEVELVPNYGSKLAEMTGFAHLLPALYGSSIHSRCRAF